MELSPDFLRPGRGVRGVHGPRVQGGHGGGWEALLPPVPCRPAQIQTVPP